MDPRYYASQIQNQAINRAGQQGGLAPFGGQPSGPSISSLVNRAANGILGLAGSLPANTASALSGGYSDPQASAAARAAATAKADTLAYLADQEAEANSALARLTGQRQVGLGNIENSANEARNALNSSFGRAQQDFNTTTTRANEDNLSARNMIDRNVARTSTGLQRLLGASGAGGSSAARFAAPYAVARQGADKMSANQTAYGRNIGDLNTNWSRTGEDFEGKKRAVETEVGQKRSALEAGLGQSEASIIQQLQDLALERARAGGQGYNTVRGQLTGFSDRINSILGRVDQLGALYPTGVSRQADVQFQAPSLRGLDTSSIGAPANSNLPSPVADTVGSYYNLLLNDRDKQQLN